MNKSSSVKNHPVVSHEQWLAARTAFLAKEKEFTQLRDELCRQRRELPWEKVDKAYVFEGPNGKEALAQLFGKRSQLVVYHFMFSPEWDEGCKSCSFWADHFNAFGVHLNHRDVALVAISRAPIAKIERFRKRMGWSLKWLSSAENSFNYDYRVSFTPDEIKTGGVARGIDALNGTYQYLDLVPKGRDEDGLEFTQGWVEYHDRYKD